MKVRVDFVTNSSSSSYITIVATMKDGTVITDRLESEGFLDKQIYDAGIEQVVNADTASGEEILDNIQEMYCNVRVDYFLDEKPHPLRKITDLKELLKIEITEEVFGDILEGAEYQDENGEFASAASAQVVATYDAQNNVYKFDYSAKGYDDQELSVCFFDDEWDEEDEEYDGEGEDLE